MKLELADLYVPPLTQFCTAEIAKYIRVHASFRDFLIAPLALGPPSDVDLARNNLAVIITSRAVQDADVYDEFKDGRRLSVF